MRRLIPAAIAIASACARPVAPPAASASPSVQVAAASELPEGRGRTILETSCTSCHGLNEVTKFRGFYTRAQWRDVVQTMVDYGAAVNEKEVEVLADYLDQHLGKRN